MPLSVKKTKKPDISQKVCHVKTEAGFFELFFSSNRGSLKTQEKMFPQAGVWLFDERKAHILMGVYLNNATAYSLYRRETKKPYFVDKTQILEQLFPLVKEENNYICITRPVS